MHKKHDTKKVNNKYLPISPIKSPAKRVKLSNQYLNQTTMRNS